MGSKIGRMFARSTRPAPSATVTRPSLKQAVPPDTTVHEPSSKLLHRLKDVYVESTTDIVTHDNPYGSDRYKLPQDRQSFNEESYLMGKVPKGYLTYQQVLEVLHKSKDSEQWSINKLASVYKVDKDDVENLLEYFSSYRVIGKTGNSAPPMKFHSLIS